MNQTDFERLYQAHAQALLGFLVYRTGDRALAEDILADAFERVYRARRSFRRRKTSEKTWIYAIALNCARDHRRHAHAEDRALQRVFPGSREPATASLSEEVDVPDAVNRALETLSTEEREVVALRYGGDLTLPEVMKLKGEKLTTIEGRLYSALRKLANELN